MRRTILLIGALLLITSAGVDGYAQNTEKKDAEKSQTTTIDAWREAAPLAEQPYGTQPAADPTEEYEGEENAALVEKRILDLERRLMEALKARDAASLKRLLADDFAPVGLSIAGAGQPADKTRFIEWALKNLELKTYSVEKTAVRVYPGTAIVTTHYKRQAKIAGAPSDGDFVATDVWVRRGSRWQAVSHHISQLPPKP